MNEEVFDNDASPFSEPFELEITDSLDLHAFLPKDVKTVLELYLQEASEKGLRFVRIIHGKGIGVQKEIVRSVLGKSVLVKDFRTGDEFSGGSGATVAELFTGDQLSSITSAHNSSRE